MYISVNLKDEFCFFYRGKIDCEIELDVVFLNCDLDGVTVSAKSFVDAVVDNLVDQVVKAVGTCRPDVHARAFPNMLHALQYLDMPRGVFIFHRKTCNGAK